jgi:hypothetical protein
MRGMEPNPYESPKVEIPGTPKKCVGSTALAVGSLFVGLVCQWLFFSALERFVKPQALGEFAGPFFIVSITLVFAVAATVTFILGSNG